MARFTVCTSPGCPELAPVGTGRCEQHKRPAWANPSQHTQQRPPDWSARRLRILKRDHFRCQFPTGGSRCGAKGGIVDHKQRVADGGSWEPDNLWTLCREHHDMKTRAEKRSA